jgi:hypothetical protein
VYATRCDVTVFMSFHSDTTSKCYNIGCVLTVLHEAIMLLYAMCLRKCRETRIACMAHALSTSTELLLDESGTLVTRRRYQKHQHQQQQQ